MAEPNLTLRTERIDGWNVLHVIGELDLSTVAEFDSELESFEDKQSIIVDLGECTFIDSSALRSLVIAHRRIREGGLDTVLVAPSQPAKRVLEVAALADFMQVLDTMEDALKLTRAT